MRTERRSLPAGGRDEGGRMRDEDGAATAFTAKAPSAARAGPTAPTSPRLQRLQGHKPILDSHHFPLDAALARPSHPRALRPAGGAAPSAGSGQARRKRGQGSSRFVSRESAGGRFPADHSSIPRYSFAFGARAESGCSFSSFSKSAFAPPSSPSMSAVSASW